MKLSAIYNHVIYPTISCCLLIKSDEIWIGVLEGSTAQHSTAQQVGGGTGDRRREDMMSSHLMVEERILEGKEGCGAALLHFCLRTSFLTSHFTQGFMHVPAEMIPEALFRIIFLHIIVAFGNPENLHFSPFSFIFHIKLFFFMSGTVRSANFEILHS